MPGNVSGDREGVTYNIKDLCVFGMVDGVGFLKGS